VRAWVLQITHYRLLNELRHRNRQPDIVPDPEGLVLADLPTSDPGPAEVTWEQHRRTVLKSALDELPPSQREALSLAFLEDLTHEQVAAELGLPLGTAKTRIRTGLQKLRSTLGPQWAALVAICLLAALGIRYRSEHATLARYDRALSLVTASDSVNLRLGPVPGTAEATHARYRSRPGAGIAVVTFSQFPQAPAGQIYQTWVRHGTTWTSLGTVEPDAGGSARLIAEDPALAALPDELEVTLEPRTGSAAPSGPVVVAWEP
jgi:RNA polymerase sigma-70 factor (ECF subfamily)